MYGWITRIKITICYVRLKVQLLFITSFRVLLHFHNQILWSLLSGYMRSPYLAICAMEYF